ncbi:MAG: hypothetical protein IH991_08790 [Planctomycetes bacterium]|nr:hypothetical protein [Planctomycetota bacterium]
MFRLNLMVVFCSWVVLTAAFLDARGEGRQEAGSKPGAGEAEKPNVGSRKAILRGLDMKVTLQVMDRRLSDVVQQLGKPAGITVLIDNRALDSVGLDADKVKITRHLEGISLRSTLNLILRELELTWTIRDGALVVTTYEEVEAQMRTEIINVADIIEALHGDYDTLVEVITTSVEPESWDEVGGPGSVEPYRGTLIVSQTQEVLEVIKSLLETLRAARKMAHADKAPPVVSLQTLGAAHQPGQAEAAIEAALDKPWKLEFENTPLSDAAAAIDKAFEITTVIDVRALDTVGLGADTPISFSARNLTLRQALRHMLRDLELTFLIQDEVLQITTEIGCESNHIRVYPVLDLLSEVRAEDELELNPQEFGFESLIEAITATIDVETWADVGGPGTITEVEGLGVLVVSQTLQVHENVEKLFTDLRKVIAQRPPVEAKNDKDAPKRLAIYLLNVPVGNPPQAGNGGVAPGGVFGQAGNLAGGQQRLDAVTADEFLEIVQELIEPNSWKDDGVYAKAIAGRLIVRHNEAVHRKISRLGMRLRILGFQEVLPGPRGGGFGRGGLGGGQGGGFF